MGVPHSVSNHFCNHDRPRQEVLLHVDPSAGCQVDELQGGVGVQLLLHEGDQTTFGDNLSPGPEAFSGSRLTPTASRNTDGNRSRTIGPLETEAKVTPPPESPWKRPREERRRRGDWRDGRRRRQWNFGPCIASKYLTLVWICIWLFLFHATPEYAGPRLMRDTCSR